MNNECAPGPLLRLDEQLSLIDWPKLEPIEEIDLGSADCLVVGAGFEDRALAALQRACRSSRHFHVGLVRYLPNIPENRGAECITLCQERGIDVEVFEYNREHPSGAGLILAEYAAKFDRVFVDVSGMSRLLIVQLIVALEEVGVEIHILYVEAEVYPPLEKEYKRALNVNGPSPSFISSGIFEIVSTPELSTVAMLGGAIRLISFPSFDPVQLSNLVQEVQPTHNNVVNGLPPSKDLAWRASAIAESNKSTVQTLQRVNMHDASTLDYRETLHLILKIYKTYSAFDRIVIAPTGSKMQAVAIGILRGVLLDLQIVYPTPQQFVDPKRYTEGVKQFYHLAFPSDRIVALNAG